MDSNSQPTSYVATTDVMPSLLHQLITAGQTNFEGNIDLLKINKVLNVIGYEAVIFPHTKTLVLKDLSQKQPLTFPWKEQMVVEAKRIFEKVAHNDYIHKDKNASRTGYNSVVEQLIDYNWLYEESDVKLNFTERSLVQFSEYIQCMNGSYKKCNLCGFLTDEGECHQKCAMMIKTMPRQY